MKAYSLVSSRRAELRRSYISFPWGKIYEHPINVASFSLERRYRGEDAVFFPGSRVPRVCRWNCWTPSCGLTRKPISRASTRAGLEAFGSDERNLGRWHLGRYAVSHTSGSQGPPLWIVQDRRNLERLFAMMTARSSLSRRPGLIEGLKRLVRPQRVAIVTFRRGFYPSGASLEFLSEIVGPYARVLRLSSMQTDFVARLREFQPQALTSYASVLEALSFQRDELQLTELRQITNSSEQLTARAQQRIEAAFGVPVTDHYGAGECLMLADSCATPGGGLHVNADWVILGQIADSLLRRRRSRRPGSDLQAENVVGTVSGPGNL